MPCCWCCAAAAVHLRGDGHGLHGGAVPLHEARGRGPVPGGVRRGALPGRHLRTGFRADRRRGPAAGVGLETGCLPAAPVTIWRLCHQGITCSACVLLSGQSCGHPLTVCLSRGVVRQHSWHCSPLWTVSTGRTGHRRILQLAPAAGSDDGITCQLQPTCPPADKPLHVTRARRRAAGRGGATRRRCCCWRGWRRTARGGPPSPPTWAPSPSCSAPCASCR